MMKYRDFRGVSIKFFKFKLFLVNNYLLFQTLISDFYLFYFSASGSNQGALDNRIEQAMVKMIQLFNFVKMKKIFIITGFGQVTLDECCKK